MLEDHNRPRLIQGFSPSMKESVKNVIAAAHGRCNPSKEVPRAQWDSSGPSP
jgi:hypothetical protein